MKILRIITLLSFFMTGLATAQGHFTLGNIPLTRLYSIDGKLAGPNILGQYLLGTSPENLEPFLSPMPHMRGGVWYGDATVPGLHGNTIIYVQLLAWDSSIWGNDFESVPENQFGATDIAHRTLAFPGQATGPPPFMQPAIVPIPEPSTWALGLVGFVAFLATQRRRVWKC